MDTKTKKLRLVRKKIGANIHNRQVSKKITLQKFSRLSGLSQELLDRYEMGKGEINIKALMQIAPVLGTSIDLLVKV